ncbi:hypothetical protein SAMN05216255_2223 [Pseudomonas segetis]|uniref:Uncharacterized protein n=1 Tax=Pseudomonas segetis TaxID=298908 RepID=A0A239DGA5_9PSED|nr:hypothetical protein SAMN05216255_2223 [Pseudomonas segetis]
MRTVNHNLSIARCVIPALNTLRRQHRLKDWCAELQATWQFPTASYSCNKNAITSWTYGRSQLLDFAHTVTLSVESYAP